MKTFLTQTIAGAALAAALAMPARAEVDIQVIETDAGHEAWLVEEPSIPIVSLELRFEGGASLDPEGQEGVTNFMVGLLEEGAGDLDAQGFATAEESLAASFSYNAADDSVSISARFLTQNMDEAVALLRQSLVEPRFDADAIERVRGQILSSIRSDLRDPNALASQVAAARIYGDHPYSRPLQGTLTSVAALTRDDLVAAHGTALARDRVHIGVAGDISADALGEMIDGLLDGLPESDSPLPDDADLTLPGDVTVVPFQTPQSVAVFAQPGIGRFDEDFFAAFVLNQILGGGGFEARLMTEVREKRGLTYGVYSYLLNKDHADLLIGRVASANDRVAEAISVIRDVWADVAENGVTEEELSEAKTYLTGAYPLRFDSNGAIANILVGLQSEGLDPSYVDTRNDMVEAVTMADIRRVAGALLQPGALTFVVVGAPEGLDDADRTDLPG